MLDAWYWILGFLDFPIGEFEKHPVSRGQDPGSANAGKGFRPNYLDQIKYFMPLEGLVNDY